MAVTRELTTVRAKKNENKNTARSTLRVWFKKSDCFYLQNIFDEIVENVNYTWQHHKRVLITWPHCKAFLTI